MGCGHTLAVDHLKPFRFMHELGPWVPKEHSDFIKELRFKAVSQHSGLHRASCKQDCHRKWEVALVG